MTDSQIVDHFRRLGYEVQIGQIGFTTESVADFFEAREKFWTRVGKLRVHDDGGLLVIENAQPRVMQPTRDIVVVSLGFARAVLGVLNPDPAAISPRYATRMD